MTKTTLSFCLLLLACAVPSSTDNVERRRPDAAIDTAVVDAPLGSSAGWESCPNGGNPANVCNLATQYCCFDQINAPNNGWCNLTSDTSCLYSWAYCDGNEDCAVGTACYVELRHSDFYPTPIYFTYCTASPASGARQMCHPGDGTCAAGTACVLAEGAQAQMYGMQSTAYVCYP